MSDSWLWLVALIPATASLATVFYSPAWTHPVLRKLAAREAQQPLRWYWRMLRYHLGCSFCQCLLVLALCWGYAAPPLMPLPPLIAFAAVAGLAAFLHRAIALCTTCAKTAAKPPLGMPSTGQQPGKQGSSSGVRPFPMPAGYRGPTVADERR